MTGKLFFTLCVLLLSATAGYAGQFGSVKPAAKMGQISQEIGYFWSQGDWSADEKDFDDALISQSEVYVQAGYGLSDNWETYFRIGAADFRIKDPVPDEFVGVEDFDMEDDLKPFVTLGARGLFYRGSFFNLGAFVQGSYYSPYEDKKTAELPGGTTSLMLEFRDHWALNAGAALQAELGGVSVYAGPILYFSRGTLEFEASALGVTESRSSTYEEHNNLGAVAGISVPLSGLGSLYFEGQYRNKISAGGAFVYLRLNH
jgi:hypothetical protein